MHAKSTLRSFTPTPARISLALLLTVLMAFPDLALAQDPATMCNTQSWTQSSFSLLNNTETFSAVVNNGFLYSIGGYSGPVGSGVGLATVAYAKLGSDGSLQSPGFKTTTALQPALARDLCGKVFTNNAGTSYLYTVGGVQYPTGSLDGATTGLAQYAKINSNGTIGAWTPTSSLSVPTQLHGSVVVGNYLYVIGGSTASNDLNVSSKITTNVWYSQIMQNGALAGFKPGPPLPIATYKTCPVVFGNTIYLSGGEEKGHTPPSVTNVYYAAQGAMGVLNPWTQESTTGMSNLPGPLASQAVVYNTGIILMGGDTGSGDIGDVWLGDITSPPTTINWSKNTLPSLHSFVNVIERNAGASFNNFIYSLGGEVTNSGGSSSDTNAVYCLQL